ncbi:hypothetical protein [Streptomyces sp. NRRL F-525]|uniref:hypothetical protein n=1 Tax=Streptomyces sp. NRRL F-525 TaxID=1463861 RepID=UPI00068D0AC6|nr:hypothetical protein [Streptomyces sp. NRRL F-525]
MSRFQTDAGWDGPYYRVRAEEFDALFLPGPDESLDEVCNVDVEVHLPDGSRWSATIFTLAEVDRLMKRWEETEEAAGGKYFWCSNGLVVRAPGIPGMVTVIADLLRSREFDGAFHRLDSSASTRWPGLAVQCVSRR